jgi:hypothetical protein
MGNNIKVDLEETGMMSYTEFMTNRRPMSFSNILFHGGSFL